MNLRYLVILVIVLVLFGGSKLPDLANSLRRSSGPAIGVVTKVTRQRFMMGYKRKIVREADACKTPGAVGALLRREELYFSHLTT